MKELLNFFVIFILGAVIAGSAFMFNLPQKWFAPLFTTEENIVCELLENKQIAELATRKIKWKVIVFKESISETLVLETIYVLKFGFDLSELSNDDIQIDHKNKAIKISLPDIRLLSVDTFGESKVIVSKKTPVGRIIGKSHDSGQDDTKDETQLIQELQEQHLLNPNELAEDFQRAISPIFSQKNGFSLVVDFKTKEIDVKKLFDEYHKRK